MLGAELGIDHDAEGLANMLDETAVHGRALTVSP
jgi:hypothetical protein